MEQGGSPNAVKIRILVPPCSPLPQTFREYCGIYNLPYVGRGDNKENDDTMGFLVSRIRIFERYWAGVRLVAERLS
jgi:hypothetical protein